MLGVMWALERLAAWEGATLQTHEPAAWTVVLALAGSAWLLAPRGFPLRVLALFWIAPLFAIVPPRPAPGEAWVDVLEVGNGLAVIVRTAAHALVFDTGPRWSATDGWTREYDRSHGRRARDHRLPHDRVAAHHLELGDAERPRRGEQTDGDRELADVVQLRGAGDILAVAAREAERERDGGRERRHLAGVVEQRRLFVGQQLQKNFGGRPASARRDSHPSDRHRRARSSRPRRHTL